MGWFIAVSDMPGRPFAVIDGQGQVAGCHSSREAASLQMTTLNVNGVEPIGADPPPKPKAPAPVPEPAPSRREEPISYSTGHTVMW